MWNIFMYFLQLEGNEDYKDSLEEEWTYWYVVKKQYIMFF